MFPVPTRLISLSRPSRLVRVAGLIAGVSLLPALGAAPANADLISTGACSNAALSQPFLPWGDTNTYELAPQGDFEGSLSQWTLAGRAHVASGSEPWGVTGKVGSHSLSIPGGSWAQSPFVCVNASYPTFRFFAHNSSLLSTMAVEVVYKTPLGTAALPLGAVTLSTKWAPTLPMLTGSLVGALLTNGTAQAALRFTAVTGETSIDDVEVDPRMS